MLLLQFAWKIMLMSVSTVDNRPLASGEFNHSGECFVYFNKNLNIPCYREHILKLKNDAFASTCSIMLTANVDAIKERKLETMHVAMDPNQSPEKITSKLMVALLPTS